MTFWRELIIYIGIMVFFFIPLGRLSLLYYIAKYQPSQLALNDFLIGLSFPFSLYRRYRGWFGLDERRIKRFNIAVVRSYWAILVSLFIFFAYLLIGYLREPSHYAKWIALAVIYFSTLAIFWRFGTKLRDLGNDNGQVERD